MENSEKINVAITGELRIPRTEAAKLINATLNGNFVSGVTFNTHYLVSAKSDSQKAKKAARLGTSIIGESELFQYIADGIFPSTSLPTYAVHQANNFPEIAWSETYSPAKSYILEYIDAVGHHSIRTVRVTGIGYTSGNEHVKWLGGYDGPNFRTWRGDRIINLDAV